MTLKGLPTSLMKQWRWANCAFSFALKYLGVRNLSLSSFLSLFSPILEGSTSILSFMGDLRGSISAVLILFVPMPPPCQPSMPIRPTVTSPELKPSSGRLFQADKLPTSSLIKAPLFCVFWESDYKGVGGRCAEGNVRHLALARDFWAS